MRTTVIRVCLALVCAALCGQASTERGVRVETVALAGGAELVTVFAEGRDEADVPLVSVLKDGLGHTGSERLRQVWVLSYIRPAALQRIAAAFPFLYWRPGTRRRIGNSPPAAVLDVSAPDRGVWSGLAGALMQSEFLDPRGVSFRAPSRGYRGNAAEYRNMEVASALELLARVDEATPGSSALSTDDWEQLQARLLLSRRLLGGLIGESHLNSAYERQYSRIQERRGHNWELLRQAAEANGLYFEPLSFGDRTPSHVLVWISKADLRSAPQHRFDPRLLGIQNPWTDASLRNWRGYSQTWYFDAQHRRVDAGTAGAIADELIPLSIYSLDSSRAPLLLADFRDGWKPKRRELLKRSADTIATGVLGWTGLEKWGYLGARTSWNWLRNRHGATVDRTERAEVYAELRRLLAMDCTLDAQLRAELQNRLDHLSINPFERSFHDENELARQQYAALLEYARAPGGLAAKLEQERGRELVAISHDRTARVFLRLATVSTFGAYRHSEPVTPEALALLDRQRRIDANVRFLRQVADSGSHIEVVWNMDEVGRRVDELAALLGERSDSRDEAVGLIGRILAQTQDADVRRRCLSCLARLNGQSSAPAGVASGSGQ